MAEPTPSSVRNANLLAGVALVVASVAGLVTGLLFLGGILFLPEIRSEVLALQAQNAKLQADVAESRAEQARIARDLADLRRRLGGVTTKGPVPPNEFSPPPPPPPRNPNPSHGSGTHPEDRLFGARRVDFESFGPEAFRIDFETGPDGERLRPGQNVEELFRSKGVRLRSDHPTGYVAVDGYVVSGVSRGYSAANNQPRWTADLTIELGETDTAWPREVKRVGFYVAAVAPGGTALEAYDADGEMLGKVYTRTNGTDFLGVEADVAIERIRVVRIPEIDPNFTIDDLTWEYF